MGRPRREELFVDLRRTVGALVAGVAVAIGGVVATSAPAQAAQVNNMYLCEPDTGWCFQTNPPYNRNFPRRSGPGKVYLASPLVVAASALAGYITTPEALFAR